MKLDALLRELSFTLDAGTADREITALVYDSRKVVPGSLFVCLTGFRSDAHDFIPAAVAAAAAASGVARAPKDPAAYRAELERRNAERG